MKPVTEMELHELMYLAAEWMDDSEAMYREGKPVATWRELSCELRKRADERAAALSNDPGVWCGCKAPRFRNAQECDKCGGWIKDAAARCDRFRASSLCAGEFTYLTCDTCGPTAVFIRCDKHGGKAGAARSLKSHSGLTHPRAQPSDEKGSGR